MHAFVQSSVRRASLGAHGTQRGVISRRPTVRCKKQEHLQANCQHVVVLRQQGPHLRPLPAQTPALLHTLVKARFDRWTAAEPCLG